jgi:hypothetical protein
MINKCCNCSSRISETLPPGEVWWQRVSAVCWTRVDAGRQRPTCDGPLLCDRCMSFESHPLSGEEATGHRWLDEGVVGPRWTWGEL